MFLYSAVSSPLDRSKRFTLLLPWQTCSFRHQLGFSGKQVRHSTTVPYMLFLICHRLSNIIIWSIKMHNYLKHPQVLLYVCSYLMVSFQANIASSRRVVVPRTCTLAGSTGTTLLRSLAPPYSMRLVGPGTLSPRYNAVFAVHDIEQLSKWGTLYQCAAVLTSSGNWLSMSMSHHRCSTSANIRFAVRDFESSRWFAM